MTLRRCHVVETGCFRCSAIKGPTSAPAFHKTIPCMRGPCTLLQNTLLSTRIHLERAPTRSNLSYIRYEDSYCPSTPCMTTSCRCRPGQFGNSKPNTNSNRLHWHCNSAWSPRTGCSSPLPPLLFPLQETSMQVPQKPSPPTQETCVGLYDQTASPGLCLPRPILPSHQDVAVPHKARSSDGSAQSLAKTPYGLLWLTSGCAIVPTCRSCPAKERELSSSKRSGKPTSHIAATTSNAVQKSAIPNS